MRTALRNRRSAGMWRARAACGVVAAWLAGCGPTAPTVTVLEPLPRGPEPALALTAARQKPEIAHALATAGFRLAEDRAATPYLLRVTLGIDQGSRPCGTLNNVRYALRRAGRTLLQVDAKGWTGTCEPNVFDAASRLLRERVLAMSRGEGT